MGVPIDKLFICAVTLFLLMVPGFTVRKLGILKSEGVKPINQILIYIGMPALLISTFIQPYKKEVLTECLFVALFSFVAHAVFTLIAMQFFKKSEKAKRNVWRFSMVFSNAMFMGVPVIQALLGDNAAIYASFYNIFFQVFLWSVGSYLFTEDRSYMMPKKIILNPGVISILIGLIIYLTGLGGIMPEFIGNTASYLKSIVTPISMIVVGIRLAECDFKSIFGNYRFFVAMAGRLFLLPAVIWAIMKILYICGLPITSNVMIGVLACSATPSAAFTVAFAEKYDGDGIEASKIVSISTLLSIGTMPLIMLLMYI